MGILGWIVFIIFGGRLIRLIINSISRSVKDEHQTDQRGPYDNRFENRQTSDPDEEARKEAYRKWQEEVYRRYREAQNQYQYRGQQTYQQYDRYRQGYGGYQNTQSPKPYDPKLEEIRRMYGHPLTLDELDDKQRELRKKYHPDNYNGDSSMFILVDQVHDELELRMK